MKIASFYSQAKMVNVGTTFNSWIGSRHQVDHAGASTKLNQANLRNAPFLVETEHMRVKVEHPVLIAASQNNMINFGNCQRNFHVQSSITLSAYWLAIWLCW